MLLSSAFYAGTIDRRNKPESLLVTDRTRNCFKCFSRDGKLLGVTAFIQDSLTSANWKGKYGKDGYMFFGGGNNNAAKKLPAYIDSIALKKNGLVIWDSASNDSRVPQMPAGGAKFASAIVTRDPAACFQTMTIDVHINDEQQHQLSLYFLDYDEKDSRSAVEIFDLETLNIIAPVQMVANYAQGKFVCFEVNKPVRIMISQVRGQNAAVSALFFN